MIVIILRRLLIALPTLWVLLTLSFFLMRAAPGGPFDRERSLPPDIEAAISAQYHLDEPLWRQYLRYLDGVMHADLGPSFQYNGYRVNELIADGLPVSATVGISAMLLGLLLGGIIGVVAGLKPGGFADRLLMSVALLGISVPAFVVAPVLVLLFAVHLGWLPAGGWPGGGWRHGLGSALVLPVVALAVPQVAVIARLMRAGVVEVMAMPYILAAKAKGLPLRRIVLRDVLKPALLPVLSYLGPATAALLTGSVVIEQIFGLPGIGRYFVQGAINRDYTLVLGVVLLYGSLIIVLNLLVDLLYSALDPRVRP